MNLVYKYGCLAPTLNADLVYNEMRGAHRYRNVLIEIERGRREALLANQDREHSKFINERAAELRLGARALCAVYWGSYQLVEAQDQAARSAPLSTRPKFLAWRGDGAISVQIQRGDGGEQGITAARLTLDQRVQLTTPDKKKHATLRLRIGTEGRTPVWAEFPVKIHRPIPPNARIKRVTVHVHRRATREVWSCEFQLQLPVAARDESAPRGVVGIDLGWRRIKDELRVCTYAVEDKKEYGELRLTAWDIGGFRKTEDLQEIRDRRFNGARDALWTWRKEQLEVGASMPEWFVERTTHLYMWRAIAKVHSLVKHWRSNRFDGDEAAFEDILAWWRKDKHLWEWQANQLQQVIESRRDKYRVFAAKLARKYDVIVLEDLDLRAFARRPDKDAPRDEAGRRESQQEERARAWRQMASTSELRRILEHAFLYSGGSVCRVPCADTTRTCNACGLVVRRDFAGSIAWTCDCGVVHDQDLNASDNLCERFRALEAEGTARIRNAVDQGTKVEGRWARVKRQRAEKEAAREAEQKEAE